MSAFVARIQRDEAPADRADIAEALRLLAPFGERRSEWCEGPLALGHIARTTTPEAAREQWPLHHPSGMTLVADARLDNRDDLIAALPLPDAPPPTDADLVLAAHERWGDEAPSHLIGDYAYALWDADKHTLFLARSPMGMRGLFYRVTARTICAATTVRAVNALGDPLPINEPWVASFFTLRLDRLWDESALSGIRKLPPGHSVCLSLEHGAQAPRRFWRLEPDERAAWPLERQRAALRECFDQAVAARLRSAGPVTIAVSGGLDSSSIALAAHDLMHKSGIVPPVEVHTHSLVMPGFPRTDEAPYRDAALARLPAFGQALLEMQRAWDWPTAEAWAARASLPALITNAYMLAPCVDHTLGVGGRVMLGGVGGDLITGGEDYGIPEALFSLPWGRRRHEARRFWDGTGRLRGLLRSATQHLMPEALRLRWQRRSGQWLLPTIRCERAAATPLRIPSPRGATPLQRRIAHFFQHPFGTLPFEYNSEMTAAFGVEYRLPFGDQRLIELAFQLPAATRIADGQTRMLFKEAMGERLPERLRDRTSKADFTSFCADSIAPADHARAVATGTPWLSARGWVDQAVWARWVDGAPGAVQRGRLHAASHLELWLREIG